MDKQKGIIQRISDDRKITKETSEGVKYEIDTKLSIVDTGTIDFDLMEYECWGLIKQYAQSFGIVFDEDDIDYRMSKGVQDLIMKYMEELGVKFNY